MNLKSQGVCLKKIIKIILFATFSLTLTMYPFSLPLNNQAETPVTDMTDQMSETDQPLTSIVYHPILSFLLSRESTTAFEYQEKISRQFQNSQRFLRDFYSQTILLFGMDLFICAFLSSFRRITKHISAIAISVGGHAPPLVLI
jgi:hypothetical protein